MVSIEDISKANKLSKELKKHGFAFDAGDAYSQAERIFDKKRASPAVEMASEAGTVVLENNFGVDLEELYGRINHLERFKEFALRKENKHKEVITELTEKMSELTKALNLIEMNQQAFERKISKVKEPSCSCESHESPSQEPKPEAEVPQAEISEPISETPNPSRNEPVDASGITPSEVAVDKIFYSGSK